MESFSGGSSKKGRAQNSGVSCLVDGCKSNLSKCRDYHRRHKVCEMHSKSPKVTIGGHEQRFCQQCSRFHSLGEFDEGKRSCRKRLEGHNRRRRKPQTRTMNDGNFLTDNNMYLAFSKQAMSTSSSWSGGVKTESSPSSVFNSSCYSQASSSAGHALHHHPTSLPSNCGTNRIITSNNGLINHVTDSNHQHRALSLLSSSQTPEMGLGRITQANPINPACPNISGMFYSHNIDHFPGNGGNTGSILMSSLCQDVIQSGSHGSTATATGTSTSAHQTLSFSWE